jgi:hypothetical protein
MFLMSQHGLFVNDVQRLDIHGGSLRLFIQPFEKRAKAVDELLAEERAAGLASYEYFRSFGEQVARLRDELRQLIVRLKQDGHRVGAYGAAAKGTILLNYVGLNHESIDWVVDRNEHKHGRFMPGVHIPVCEPDRLLTDRPAYTLLLPWNFREEILHQQQAYRDSGGRFIVPIPTPQIV